ncbi:hypothetical protein [Paraburkholderia bannensis]|uniref:hypothetical protein n=1 Tax=Paraburkholderia bannensis TaxID=765414 RepID=UPI002ABD7D4B|nr:hypothetical protein [Paraburkholderia bannensis]
MLKAILKKIASWFKSEAVVAEQKAEAVVSELRVSGETDAAALLKALGGALTPAHLAAAAPISPVFTASSVSVVDAATGAGYTLSKDGVFPITNSTTEVDMNNVNVAIQIALTLKANDPSLTDAAVQAATNAALAAAYPAPAPTPAA